MESEDASQNTNPNSVEKSSIPLQATNTQPAEMSSNQSPTQSSEPNKSDESKISKKNIGIAIVLIVLILVPIVVIAFQEFSKTSDESAVITEELPTNEPLISPTEHLEENTNDTSLSEECKEFPDMLENCTEYTCEFTHPLTGDILTREIVGVVNTKCSYTEEMPNNGRMDCEYSEKIRKAIAQQHRDINKTGTYGTEGSIKLGPEETEVNITYTIDGEIVENPLQEALDTGECVVSGY